MQALNNAGDNKVFLSIELEDFSSENITMRKYEADYHDFNISSSNNGYRFTFQTMNKHYKRLNATVNDCLENSQNQEFTIPGETDINFS